MANRYWVGGTGTWDGTAGSKWSLTSGGSGGEAVPTSSDTVFFNAASGAVTVTIASGAICSTLTMTGFTGTLAFGSNSISCAGTGTVFAGATTFSVTGTPLINIIGTGVATRAVNTGAVTEANSISFNVSAGTSQLSIVNGSRIRSLIFSGTSTGSFNAGASAITIYGDLTFKAGMSITGGTGTKTFAATSGTQNITSPDGLFRFLNFPITFSGTATYKLQTDFNNASNTLTRIITLSSGTLDLNGFTLYTNGFATGAGTKNITFNSGIFHCGGTFNNANPTGFTTTAGTGTGYIYISYVTDVDFIGGGSTYNCTLVNLNALGALQITGSNTFNDIENSPDAVVVYFEAGSINTFNNFNFLGSAGNLVTIGSITAGSTFTLSKSSGTVSTDYLSISDSVATGGAEWYAGAHSVNSGHNYGWQYRPPIVSIRYWVGGSGTWDGTSTTHWSATSGGAGGDSAPTAGTAVIIDANSGGGTIDIDSSVTQPSCAVLDFTGFTGTVTTSVTNGTLYVYGDAVFSDTATYTNWTARFVADAGMFNTEYSISYIDTVNIVVANGAKLTLNGTFHVAAIRLMDSSWFFSGYNNLRAVYIESVSGNNIFEFTGTYFITSFVTIKSTDTVFADNSLTQMQATYNNLGDSVWEFHGGGHTYYDLNILTGSVIGEGVTGHGIFDSNTFHNIYGNNTVGTVEFEAGTTQTITGKFSLSGYSGNSITLKSMTPGSQFTLSQVGVVGVDYLSLQDSNATGGAAWYAGAHSTNVSNNTGWTFTAQPPVNRYWVGGNGDWDTTSVTNWSATSGGAGGAYAPTSIDAVFFDANSYGTINLEYGVSAASLDFTGFTGAFVGTYNQLDLSGNLTLGAAGTYISFSVGFLTPATLTFNGASTSNMNIVVYSDGILTLNGDISVYNFELQSSGTLITDNFNVTVNYIHGTGSETSTFNFGSSLITASYVYIRPGDTVNAGTSTFNMNNAVNESPYAWEFYGGGHTYYNLNFSSDSVAYDGYSGGFFDNNTFHSITNSVQPITVSFQSGSTQTITGTFGVAGTSGNLVTLFGDNPGTQFTLSKASGTVSTDYLSLQDSNATGGAEWYAGTHSTNVSNNTGWTFTAPPAPGGQTVTIGAGIILGAGVSIT